MKDQRNQLSDTVPAHFRVTVAAIDNDISRLLLAHLLTADHCRSPANGLAASRADLAEQLELGPEPEVSECPVCKHIGMRAAIRCDYCGTMLAHASSVYRAPQRGGELPY